MRHQRIKLGNFANNQTVASQCLRPEYDARLMDTATPANATPLLVRGEGLSYNDSPLLQDGYTLLSDRFNHFLDFDADSGIVVCQPGIPLKDLFSLHPAWMPAVVPGTVHASIGGCLSHDVHGKNQPVAGTFADHVRWFELIIADKRYKVSPHDEPELWRATVGGAGLVGIISKVALQLKKQTRGIRVCQQKITTHAQLLAEMRHNGIKQDYQVAWLDLIQGQRAVLSYGRHSNEPSPACSPGRFRMPGLPFSLLSRTLLKNFNRLYYHKSRPTSSLMDFIQFNNPLDSLPNWQNIYGRRGLKQFQCLFPTTAAENTLAGIKKIIGQYNALPCLSVLKYCNSASTGYLSFVREGYTLAIDFKNNRKSTAAIKALNAFIAQHGGRVYLAKDTELDAALFQQMYPDYKHLMDIRRRFHSPMQSLMGQRLGITA